IVGKDFRRYTLSDGQIERVFDALDRVDGGLTTVALPGLGSYRVNALEHTGTGEPAGAFGLSTASESLTLRQMLWSIALATIGGMLLLGVATSGVIRQGLRP